MGKIFSFWFDFFSFMFLSWGIKMKIDKKNLLFFQFRSLHSFYEYDDDGLLFVEYRRGTFSEFNSEFYIWYVN